MRFLIEFDGPIGVVADAFYAAHVESASQVGWSKLDQPSFWRLIRTKGNDAEILMRAPDLKIKDYRERFNALLETAPFMRQFTAQPQLAAILPKLARHGPLNVVTLGGNAEERKNLLKAWKFSSLLLTVHSISADPRKRPGELRSLTGNDKRAIVVGCSDALIRAADAAELFTVGLTCGACGVDRLHRAGPRIVFKELGELASSLAAGGADLIRAGLLPPTPGLP